MTLYACLSMAPAAGSMSSVGQIGQISCPSDSSTADSTQASIASLKASLPTWLLQRYLTSIPAYWTFLITF